MRHRVAGRQLGRTTSHRKAMRRNLAASLFEHGAVRTTPAKAKEVRPFAEKLISLARRGTLHARRQVIALLGDRNMVDPEERDQLAEKTVVQRLFDEIAPRYVDRPGGYTRIINLPERRIGDAGRQVLLQLVEEAAAGAGGEETFATAGRRREQAARRAEAAQAAAAEHEEADAPADEPAPAADEAQPAPEDGAAPAGGEDEEEK